MRQVKKIKVQNLKGRHLGCACVSSEGISICVQRAKPHLTKQMLVGQIASMGIQTILETKQNEVVKIVDPVSMKAQSKGTNILFSALD